jgi:hypothetical protein
MIWLYKCFVDNTKHYLIISIPALLTNVRPLPTNIYVSPSNEGRHIVLVWFFLPLLLLLLNESCPDNNFFNLGFASVNSQCLGDNKLAIPSYPVNKYILLTYLKRQKCYGPDKKILFKCTWWLQVLWKFWIFWKLLKFRNFLKF